MSTSYEQKKSEHCKKDSASDNTSCNSSNTSRIDDAISDILGGLDISNNDDDKLFADPPPKEDCPICMLPMPHSNGLCGVATIYMPCCGKTVCCGCMVASAEEVKKGNLKKWCPLCRVPIEFSNDEIIERSKKRMKLNDACAFYTLGSLNSTSLPKELELLNTAAELGSIEAHFTLANRYKMGDGVQQDVKTAVYHTEFAAIGGHEMARHNLGIVEKVNGNIERAYKHWMIAARAGAERSLKAVGEGYKAGHVTKDEYANTLRAYKDSQDAMKSQQREEARFL